MPATAPLAELALAAAGSLAHAAPPGVDATWSPDGTLAVTLAEGTIAAACFRPGADPLGDAFRELYCRTVEGLPAEEAAAYGAAYLVHTLAAGQPAGGPGIANPRHVHPALAAAEDALRALRPTWRPAPGMAPIDRAQFLELPPAWLVLTTEERLAALRSTLAAAVAAGEAADLGLTVERLEDDIRGRPVRVTLGYPPPADHGPLPDTMRAIERLFRTRVAPWLEIYAEERQDHNKLRRTILIDHRPPAA